MNYGSRIPLLFATAGTLTLATAAVLAQDTAEAVSDSAPYTPLALQNRHTQTGHKDYAGTLQLGLGYVGDDNYMFGQYNGLNEEGASVIGNLQWQDFSSGGNYWQTSFSDLGLDTREGKLSWGKPDKLRLTFGFDSQQQVRNDSGKTPFRGDDKLQLPNNWASGLTTGDFATLEASAQEFDRIVQRDKLFIAANANLNEHWQLETNLSYEEKQGNSDMAGGIYVDGSSADAALLRSPVDYQTTQFDLGLSYTGHRLHLNGQLGYSEFENNDDSLTWQNPYSSFGPNVAFPSGTGGISLAPDNEQTSARLTGHYIFSATTRLQFDGSYAVATQDQDYLDYTVNQNLVVTEPLPTTRFDGEVATSTANARLLLRPLSRLNVEVFYKLRDRDYDADRNDYLYVRGDAGGQPEGAFTVYNTNHDLTSQTAGLEASYRLPLRSRLGFEYAYEKVERRNAAVEGTEEDRYILKYRIQPWSSFSTRIQLQYADRAADTYQWAQSYYALLDTELINRTPDNQRYINHPQLKQYYLSNRDRMEAKVDFGYLPSPNWNLNLNVLWRDDDYDKSEMGLTQSQWGRAHLSASYAATQDLSASIYAGYDQYEGTQSSRSFRGGQEKNAFDIYQPLPQASDPAQDWELETTDSSVTIGFNVQWRVAADFEVLVDYNFVETNSEQGFHVRPGSNLSVSSLPDVDTRLHQMQASGTWQIRDDLSLQLDYQFYSYETDDWAWENLQADSIQKVLTFGQSNPNEDIHYVGVSVNYRWQ